MLAATVVGLCASCSFHRIVQTRTGSRFYFCERSRTDAAFPRYPALPVLACRGYERIAEYDVADDESSSNQRT